MSKNVDEFLDKFGFINYNKDVFDPIDTNKLNLIQKILDMRTQDYEILMAKLRNAASKNREMLDSYYKNNTFLFNLIHN